MVNGRLTGSVHTWELNGLERAAEAGTLDWFATADAISVCLVPSHAVWCVLYVRDPVLEALRSQARPHRLDPPNSGEPAEMVALRHRDGHLETLLRQLVDRAPYLHPAPIAPDPPLNTDALSMHSATLTPVATPAGDVVGALWLGPRPPPTVGHSAVAAGHLAGVVGAALDTARRVSPAPMPDVTLGAHRVERWRPPDTDAVVPAARAWVRHTLPTLLAAPVTDRFRVALDLLVGELTGNAVQHGDGLVEMALTRTANRVRVAVRDRDPRAPIVRDRSQAHVETGRGVPLVNAIAAAWGVRRRPTERGKWVWAELVLEGGSPY